MIDLRKLAQGQDCRLRIPGICNYNPETTVLCHIKERWCGSIKPPDICGVHGCSACHDEFDGRTHKSGLSRAELDQIALGALCEQLCWYQLSGINITQRYASKRVPRTVR